jgi:hypothetical protein
MIIAGGEGGPESPILRGEGGPDERAPGMRGGVGQNLGRPGGGGGGGGGAGAGPPLGLRFILMSSSLSLSLSLSLLKLEDEVMELRRRYKTRAMVDRPFDGSMPTKSAVRLIRSWYVTMLWMSTLPEELIVHKYMRWRN